ncbi:MAG TPA: ferrochelatase [Vicinamibacterales bacterium]|nr:ferrochelatase [Vicinamibacterales bacterium]
MNTGVLLMAHGTPSSMDEMPEYLRLVRGGRLPSPELVVEMRHNYEAIGGRSPLTELTLAQANALTERLGNAVPVTVGMRNWTPFIKDAIEGLASAGVARVIGIPLAPQFSTLSVTKYFDAAASALPAGITMTRIESFHDHPLLIDAFASRVRAADPAADESVIFTAHSLPQRAMDNGDPYADEVAATARLVAAGAGVKNYTLAYQSAGRTPEPWIGPALDEHIAALAATGVRKFLVVPVGFVCDHTEILFDVDVQAKAAAAAAGASLRRTESLNSSPAFIRMLEDLVKREL